MGRCAACRFLRNMSRSFPPFSFSGREVKKKKNLMIASPSLDFTCRPPWFWRMSKLEMHRVAAVHGLGEQHQRIAGSKRVPPSTMVRRLPRSGLGTWESVSPSSLPVTKNSQSPPTGIRSKPLQDHAREKFDPSCRVNVAIAKHVMPG